MKKFFSALFVVLFATNVMAQTGLTCDDPIPVDKSYRGKVDGPCTLWYTANTYDLPLTVYFLPDSTDSKYGPDVVVDFTCTTGVYENPKLDSIINTLSDFSIELPIEFMCDQVFREGRRAWELSIDEKYRNQLTEFGLTDNVQAFVQVTFFESGTLSLTPDTSFTYCIS